MVEYPQFSDEDNMNSLDSIRPDDVPSKSSRVRSLIRDRRFRTAWVVSFFLHIVLFASAMWSPTSAKYRFYGSGTAVSLVGADEIPGGSAKGKSGDKPQALAKPESSKGKKARKIEVKKKKEEPKKKEVKKKKPKKVEKKVTKKKPTKKKVVKKKPTKKKKIDKKRLARLRKIKERRERQKRWREKWEKEKNKNTQPPKNEQKPQKEIASAGKSDSGAGNDQLAKTTTPPRRKPLAGYPGEGGGDGQGGGSLGGGSGGVARTDVERYYGLIAERIRNFWTVPPNLTDVAALKTEVVVDVARDGTIRNLRIQKGSGNRIYDTAALRAVERSADPTFPAPPNTMKESWLYLGFRFCGRNICK